MESDHLKYHGRCKKFGKGCTWMIRISLRARKGTWEVRRYNGPHTCLATSISSDHRQLDYHVICAKTFSLVCANAAVSIKVLQEPRSYRRNVRVQAKLQEDVVGKTEGDSTDIRGLGRVLRRATSLDPWCAVHHGGDGYVVEDISAFRHCKPFVSIDDTHLYGKYGGTLLLAIAQDGNSNILPIAFSLVEGKNAESWSFFLTNLRQHVTPQQGILVISDRHNGIKAALENPNNGCFKGIDAKRLLVNAAYAKTEAEFDYWFDIMRTENPAMCDWANRIEYDKWT
ncbi:uncharacterized protein LOC107637179 [Arachis ipaensis]|uniref:uncharacterized protein LOC107637179 n=1 Tax=Arachis ipaensis TaxID=130454 RepID=UPI0007AF63FC|nr:uncharacterized protein LOC107637179 [Arachis ipaensis]XP_025648247.1 uncharacterized protein LOC112743243 [Arachis hypogaea]